VLGCLFAVSSTAIVMRGLGERRELDAPHGRFIVGVLLFQDLLVVPMVLVVPMLGGDIDAATLARDIGAASARALGLVALVLLAARYLVPRVLGWVDASRSRELFLLSVLTLCIGTAWLTSLAGLSLALGAFLGGFAVADTRYGHRALGDILPLRDAFVSLFFVSLGMLLDARVFVQRPLAVLLLLSGFVVLKGAVATLSAIVMRFPPRAAWLAGVGLAQFGEFGFVVLGLARPVGVVGEDDASVLMAAGILSMAMTPLLLRLAPHVRAGERWMAPLSRLLGADSIADHPELEARLRDHALIVGFGVAGRAMASAMVKSEQPYVVLELNAENVTRARAADEPVFYGDATSPEALEHAGIERARVIALMINDPSAVPRVIEAIRKCRTEARVIVRAHYLSDREALLALGAHEVVVEEVESGVEIVARALHHMGVPRNVVARRVVEAREATLAGDAPRAAGLLQSAKGARLRVDSVLVSEGTTAIGRSVGELDLRKQTDALVLAIERDEELIQRSIAETPLKAGDVLHLAGTEDALALAEAALSEPAVGEPALSDGPAES
jgi:CPA2 family monovalent cation:H+ antiporter-2